MKYIEYNLRKKKFISTGNRPNNQGGYDVLVKISNRLQRIVAENPTLEHTAVQKTFIKNLGEEKEAYKRSKDNIDIAHGIAISKIIALFIKVLNEPTLLKKYEIFNNLNSFFDAALSTESPSSMRTKTKKENVSREKIRDFLENLKSGKKDSNALCEEANIIIHHLNKCSRNLVPGDSSKNRTLGEFEDPPLILVKEKKDVAQKIAHALKISAFFKKIEPSYNAKKTKEDKNICLSSSVGFFSDSNTSNHVKIKEKPKKIIAKNSKSKLKL